MAASRRTPGIPSRYGNFDEVGRAIKDIYERLSSVSGGGARVVSTGGGGGGGGGTSETSTYTDFLTQATVNKEITITSGEVWACTNVDLEASGIMDIPATSELLLIG